MRFAYGIVLGFLLASSLAFAAFSPKGVTHHNLLAVTETISPCTTTRDRPLLEFTTADAQLMVVTWDDATKALKVVSAAACATLATTTTTTTTTTTSTAAPTTTT